MTDPSADSTIIDPGSPATIPGVPGPTPTVSTSTPDVTPTDQIFIDTSGSTDSSTAVTSAAAPATPDPAVSAPYAIDEASLKAAKGDTHIWAAELADMIGHTTGTWIAPDTFIAWFATYADQVERAQARTIVFDIANTPIGEAIDGDAGTLLLDLRNDLAFKVRKRVGLL